MPHGAGALLRGLGFEVVREPMARRALPRLFLQPHDLVVIGHWPPTVDANVIVQALRRQRGCASRRASIIVALVRPDRQTIEQLRLAGVSFVCSAPLGQSSMRAGRRGRAT